MQIKVSVGLVTPEASWLVNGHYFSLYLHVVSQQVRLPLFARIPVIVD